MKVVRVAPAVTSATAWPQDGQYLTCGVHIVRSDAMTIPNERCRQWFLMPEERLAKGCTRERH